MKLKILNVWWYVKWWWILRRLSPAEFQEVQKQLHEVAGALMMQTGYTAEEVASALARIGEASDGE